MRQSGDYTGDDQLTLDGLRTRLHRAVDNLDVEKARCEVAPFVRDRRALEVRCCSVSDDCLIPPYLFGPVILTHAHASPVGLLHRFPKSERPRSVLAAGSAHDEDARLVDRSLAGDAQ